MPTGTCRTIMAQLADFMRYTRCTPPSPPSPRTPKRAVFDWAVRGLRWCDSVGCRTLLVMPAALLPGCLCASRSGWDLVVLVREWSWGMTEGYGEACVV